MHDGLMFHVKLKLYSCLPVICFSPKIFTVGFLHWIPVWKKKMYDNDETWEYHPSYFESLSLFLSLFFFIMKSYWVCISLAFYEPSLLLLFVILNLFFFFEERVMHEARNLLNLLPYQTIDIKSRGRLAFCTLAKKELIRWRTIQKKKKIKDN